MFEPDAASIGHLHPLLNYFTGASGYAATIIDCRVDHWTIREQIDGGVNLIANVDQFASGTADIYASGTYLV